MEIIIKTENGEVTTDMHGEGKDLLAGMVAGVLALAKNLGTTPEEIIGVLSGGVKLLKVKKGRVQ